MKRLLTDHDRQQLLKELQHERSRRYADRIRVILLLDQGKTYKSIAEYLFLDEGSIANYRKRYDEGKLEALINDFYQGKKSLLSEKQIKLLSEHLGSKIYLSTLDIIAHVEKRFGISYTISGMTDLLHRIGFTYKKAKAVPGKAKRADQELFVLQYQMIKSEAKIYFADSVHPQHNPVLARGWIRKGQNQEVFSNSGRFHLNINGAVDIKDLDIITRTADVTDAGSICELLRAIKAKNPEERELVLVMDNARYNRSQKVKELAIELGIHLFYLPPYSPNLNPIERLWKFFKKKVMYNQYYESVREFTEACGRFFKYVRKYRDELSSLLTDNFQIVGT